MRFRTKSFMPLAGYVYVFALLAMTAFGACLQGAPEPVDPLVGGWIWHANATVTFKADGTVHHSFGFDGSWEYLHNPEVQRHYRITWQHGRSVDEAVCSEDGLSAHVRASVGGSQFDARRMVADQPVAAPVSKPSVAPETTTGIAAISAARFDPIVGEWQWPKGNRVTFLGDGTMSSAAGPRGVWMFLRNPEGDRKYVLDWNYGLYTDHLTYDGAARTGHYTNQKGDSFNVTQGAATTSQATATPSTPASYFGAPGR